MLEISYTTPECLKNRTKFTGRVRLACTRREALQEPRWISLMRETVSQIEEPSVKQVTQARVVPTVPANRVPLPKGRGQLASSKGMEENLEKVEEANLRERCSGAQPGGPGRKLQLTW